MRQVGHVKGNIVEKILRDKEGKLVRAQFCVYEDAGRIKARLLHAAFIDEKAIIKNEILFLDGHPSKKNVPSQIVSYGVIVSPYIKSNLLYSSGSKPRAPTF